jgi:hypothetical protein
VDLNCDWGVRALFIATIPGGSTATVTVDYEIRSVGGDAGGVTPHTETMTQSCDQGDFCVLLDVANPAALPEIRVVRITIQ